MRVTMNRQSDTVSKLAPIAKAGYFTKGVLYLCIGGVSLMAGIKGRGLAPEGTEGVMQLLAAQPFGAVLLSLVAAGLCAYALWRLLQALYNPLSNDAGDGRIKNIVKRIGYGLNGIFHLGLGFLAFQTLAGVGGGDVRSYVRTTMSAEGGKALIVGVAVGVAIAAILQVYKAATTDFRQEVDTGRMDPKTETLVVSLGRIGLAARAVVFGIIALFLYRAGATGNADKAKETGDALTHLARQPYGLTLLSIVAIGLAAYGVFMLITARYLRVRAA